MGGSRLWGDAVGLARLFSLTHQGKLAEWDSGVSFNSEIKLTLTLLALVSYPGSSRVIERHAALWNTDPGPG